MINWILVLFSRLKSMRVDIMLVIICGAVLLGQSIYWEHRSAAYKADLDKIKISYEAISHNLESANNENVKMLHDLSASNHKIRHAKLSNDCQPSLDYIVDNIRD